VGGRLTVAGDKFTINKFASKNSKDLKTMNTVLKKGEYVTVMKNRKF
jgi:hypothetical protein